MTKTIRVNVCKHPELFETLKSALDTGNPFFGWQVTQYSEPKADGVPVCTFLLEDSRVY